MCHRHIVRRKDYASAEEEVSSSSMSERHAT